jgi:hypothetical protein
MNSEVASGTSNNRWTRVSSLKPQLFALSTVVAGACVSFSLTETRIEWITLVAGGIAVAAGLIALTSKVVHKRGNEYRISTMYYSEIVTVDDVCMTVTKAGPCWKRIRIHLRRPARFGWALSFVPIGDARPNLHKNAELAARKYPLVKP